MSGTMDGSPVRSTINGLSTNIVLIGPNPKDSVYRLHQPSSFWSLWISFILALIVTIIVF
jgi:hypothetical protein